MKNEERINEICSGITAFSEKSYSKSLYLPELLKVQDQVINLTFNAEHAENGDLRLWDVAKHFEQLNEERGNVADIELGRFSELNGKLINDIKAEISGNIGEQKVVNELEKIHCKNRVLTNVVLEYDNERTEIDAIVITNYAIFIIEVKSSKKNILISEDGRFQRVGKHIHYDCNIAEKMDRRERLLRKALQDAKIEYLNFFKIVAFTNPYIDVENNYKYIKVLPHEYLAAYIDKFTSNIYYSSRDITQMIETIDENRCAEPYQMSIDKDEYKIAFATLMTKLEIAETSEAELEENSHDTMTVEPTIHSDKKINFKPIFHSSSRAGVTAAAIAGMIFINATIFITGKALGK